MSKKILLIESCEKKVVLDDYSSTSIVHVRNSLVLKNNIDRINLVTHQSQIQDALKHEYSHIICHYASPYMKYKAYMELIDANPNAKIWFLTNDYQLEDNVLLRNYIKKYHKPYNVICNNPRSGYRHWILGKNLEGKKLNDWIDDWVTVNLNCLIVDGNGDQIPFDEKGGCIYYGTFRKHRAKDMAHFNGINEYTISTSVKNKLKFDEANIQANFISKLNWTVNNEDLKRYKYSIYFEDDHTHDNYAFLANRFYECLMCNVVLFFDAKCIDTIKCAERHGYKIDNFLVVDSANDINEKMKLLNSDTQKYLSVLALQRNNLAVAIKEKQETLKYLNFVLL